MSIDDTPAPVELLVCTTCRMGLAMEDGATRPGAVLLDKLSAAPLPAGIELKAVACLSNCSAGCNIVLRGGDQRWTYVYGNIDPEAALDEILDGIAKYSTSDSGVVPWRERPTHFRKNCVARVPPLRPLAEEQTQ
ncbi:MAG: DUF1636 domain-containing protein [Pseudomonadota bacterium]